MYNISKIFTEELVWIRLSDDEKLSKFFEDRYNFISKIDSATSKNDSFIYTSQDGQFFYLARYYLYPKKIYWSKHSSEKAQYTVEFHEITKKISHNSKAIVLYEGKKFKGFVLKND